METTIIHEVEVEEGSSSMDGKDDDVGGDADDEDRIEYSPKIHTKQQNLIHVEEQVLIEIEESIPEKAVRRNTFYQVITRSSFLH